MKKNSILEATGMELENMMFSFLTELENNMQLASDAGKEELADEISADFNSIEKIYLNFKNSNEVNNSERQFIRATMKHNLKLSAEFTN